MAGAVPLLIALLRSDQTDVQVHAASAVISLVGESQGAGAVPLLVTLLRSDKPALQSSAATALGAFGRDFGSCAVVEAGIVPLPVALAKPASEMCRRQQQLLCNI